MRCSSFLQRIVAPDLSCSHLVDALGCPQRSNRFPAPLRIGLVSDGHVALRQLFSFVHEVLSLIWLSAGTAAPSSITNVASGTSAAKCRAEESLNRSVESGTSNLAILPRCGRCRARGFSSRLRRANHGRRPWSRLPCASYLNEINSAFLSGIPDRHTRPSWHRPCRRLMRGALIAPRVDIENRPDERFWRLLRQVMTRIRHDAVLMTASKAL
jgi:hypothetical protein